MKTSKQALVLAAILAPTSIFAATLSVHTTVFCPGGKSEVTAYFEQSNGSGQIGQSCKFLHLSNNPSAQDALTWQASVDASKSLALNSGPLVSVANGLMRQDGLDNQGRVRSTVWTSQGQKVKSALFDDKGNILSMDKWRNQTTVPDAVSKMTCGQVFESALNIKLFNTATGNINAEVADVEFLADLETSFVLEKKFNLPKTAYAPGPLSSVQASPTVVVSSSKPTAKTVAKSVPTYALSPKQVATIAPTAIPTAVPVTTRGTTVAATVAPTALPTAILVPTGWHHAAATRGRP